MLHGLERIAKLLNLVVALDDGQRGLEVASCHFVGRERQMLQRGSGMTNRDVADEKDQRQRDDQDQHGDEDDDVAHQTEKHIGNDDAHRPARLTDRTKGDIRRDALDIDLAHKAFLAFHHLAADNVIERVGGLFDIVLESAFQHQSGIGVNNKRAVTTDDEAMDIGVSRTEMNAVILVKP